VIKQPRHVLLLAIAFAAFGQQAAPPAPKPLLLWKATSGTKTAYLFGSLHLGDKSFYPLSATVENAFVASDVLIVEVDIRNVNMATLAATIMKDGMYSGGDSIWDHISPETRKALEAYCKRSNLPVDMFANMKPWLAAMTLSILPFQRAGLDPSLGLDQHFLEEAGSKRVDPLETAEWQLRLFTSLTPEVQEKLLASLLDSDNDPLAESKELIATWKSGDPARIEELLRKHSEGPPEFSRKILEDRNPHMADAIAHCLQSTDRCFMVVGAAHLVGKEGVVELLGQRGIQVQQMKAGQ
jgi:uncharacterized protein YbaP (TraB family)